MSRHEIYVSRRNATCGNYQITFIFTLLIVNQDDHLSGLIIGENLLNRTDFRNGIHQLSSSTSLPGRHEGQISHSENQHLL
jgi:hypothetical protein